MKNAKSETVERSDGNIRNVMSLAIGLNNRAFIAIKKGDFDNAFKTCKKCVMFIEPLIFEQLKLHEPQDTLNDDPEFIEKVQVLLVVYYNMGITQVKINNQKYAKVVFEHGWKMARKLLGQGSYFEKKFYKNLNSGDSFPIQIDNDDNEMTKKYKKFRPSSSYVANTQDYKKGNSDLHKMNSSYQKYRSQKLGKQLSQRGTNSKVITKSNKRKIFTSSADYEVDQPIPDRYIKKGSRGGRNTNMSMHSEGFGINDAPLIDEVVPPKSAEIAKKTYKNSGPAPIPEDTLKKALEEARKEAEKKYDEKLKNAISEINKNQQTVLGTHMH